MPIDEAQKNSLVINVSNLIRHSHVKVDAQRFALAFRTLVEELEPGQPLDLEPLFHYFQQAGGVGEKEALELCIVIASRKDKLGVGFTLPVKAQGLSSEAIEHIVGQHKDKRANTGSWDVRKPEPEKPLPGKKVEPEWSPKKKKAGGGFKLTQRQKLFGVLGASIFLAVSFHSWRLGTLEPEIAPIAVPPGGLPCVEIVTNGSGTAICNLPEAVYKAGPEETLKAKGLLTKKALKEHHVTSLWVRIKETNKIRMVF